MQTNKLVKNSIIIMIFIIFGKILAFVRDALIAAKFGVSYATDIYMFSLGIVYLLTTIGYGLTTTFIPIHTEFIESNSREEANKFSNNVLNVSMIFTTVLIFLGVVGAYFIVYVFAPGFKDNINVFNTSVSITRIMLVSLIFMSIQSVITGVLQAHKQFYEPSAMALFSNVVFIGYLVLLASKYGIIGFAVATVVGFLVQLVINIPKYKMLGYSYKPYINFNDPSLKKLIILMIPVIISTSTAQLSLFINRFFATTIYEGAVSALDFSNKLNSLVYEVFAVAISMVIYPVLSSFAAKNNTGEYKRSLLKALNMIALVMVPAAVAMGVLRYPIINIIFRRGAFDERAVALTASAFLFYCPAMIAYGLRDVLNKAFYSLQDTRTPMFNSLFGIIINIFLNILLIKNMKVSGLTFASTISAIITTVILIVSLNKKMKNIGIRDMLKSFVKIISASFIMGVSIFLLNHYVLYKLGDGFKGSIFSLLSCFIIGIIIYLVFIYLFRLEEFVYILKVIQKRFKKP
jgi:putative peptidoglycan lipid II flippase